MMASNPLLPKTDRDFSNTDFWDKFIKARGSKNFEWYGEYTSLCGLLHKYVRTKDRVLVLGCGNSTLSQDLFDTGHCRQVTSIDNSSAAIRQMRQRHARERPELKFLEMDATNMTQLDDGAFTCAIDKATLDAIYSHDDQRENARKMLQEASRVLSTGGRYIIISLAQQHIVGLLREVFGAEGAAWLVRAHLVPPTADSVDFQLPVFAFVFTKCVPNPRLPKIIEVENPGAEKLTRLGSLEELSSWISSLQEASVLCSSIKPDEEGRVVFQNSFQMCSFVAFIINQKGPCEKPFAVFLVPFGQHNAPAFTSVSNRLEIARSVGASRLLLIFLNPRIFYDSQDAIQANLSSVVMRYAPRRVESSLREADIPFLSCGEVYPSRKVKVSEAEAEASIVVEEIADWGRRVLPLSRCPFSQPIAAVPTNRSEEHARVWLETAICDGSKRRQVFIGGSQPVFPSSASAECIDVTCCLGTWGSAEVKKLICDALRNFVLAEAFQKMLSVENVEEAPEGKFDVVVWNESCVLPGLDTAMEVAQLKRLLSPQGVLILLSASETCDSVPVLEYDVTEPVLDDSCHVRIWTEDPKHLFAAMFKRAAQPKQGGDLEEEEDEEDEEEKIVKDICSKLEEPGNK